jgi:segregation and condensation protein A
MTEYKIKFEVFEGPLDLLLYLIKKEEVDIYQVNLTRLATQFIEYIDLMRKLDLEIAGEFVVMASTLMYIKSRELLPRSQQVEGAQEEEEDKDDPRWELIRQLVEYKKFKDAAARLQAREIEQEMIFPRMPALAAPAMQPARRPKAEASLFDLIHAISGVLKRLAEREELRDIFDDKWIVSDKIQSLMELTAEWGVVKFSDLFNNASSRSELVCTFLALLELVRLKELICVQTQEFGEIEIMRASPAASAPARVQTTMAPQAGASNQAQGEKQ